MAEKASYKLDIVSPLGDKIPLDSQGLIITQMVSAMVLTGNLTRRYEDRNLMNRLNDTLKIDDVHVADFDGIYLVGGHV